MIEASGSKSILHSFIIFDAVPPTAEGADPIIYWFYSQEDVPPNFKLNITGILITFINFCQKWGTSGECDYINTKEKEIGILELSGDIWMAVVVNSTTVNDRSLLSSLLKYCKIMFSHFFVPIPQKNDKQKIIDSIQKYDAFNYIVESINWESLDVTYIFNSYHSQPIEMADRRIAQVMKDLENVCLGILNATPKLFDNILIMYRKHRVVYSTFDSEVTLALSFAMRKKFKYMYLHNPVTAKEFAWVIGLYVNDKGITSVYQQPLYVNGVAHLFVAFKYHKFKIVLTTPNDLELSDDVYVAMPERLSRLRAFLKNVFPRRKSSVVPFIRVVADGERQSVATHSDRVETQAHQALHSAFIHAHELAVSYAPHGCIGVPVAFGYSVICRRLRKHPVEALIAVGKPGIGASEYTRCAAILLNDNEPPPKETCIVA